MPLVGSHEVEFAMRRWHKILAPWFSALMLLLGVTGVAIEATDLLDHKPMPTSVGPAIAGNARAALATCAPSKSERSEMGKWNHWLKKVHSGEVAGPVGAALNLAGGTALLFFAISGLWMYIQMAMRLRRVRTR